MDESWKVGSLRRHVRSGCPDRATRPARPPALVLLPKQCPPCRSHDVRPGFPDHPDHARGTLPRHPLFGYLFNSYYDAVGDRWPRPARGLLSRPTVAEVYAYRRAVDEGVLALLETAAEVAPVVELGLNHEEQHQELLLTDLKHAL